MWEIEFYRTPDGKCPTWEFLDGLSKVIDLPFVMNDLDRLEEFGNQLRRPQADFLDRGIYELRTRTPSGQIRLLYFFFYQEKIIISHGIRKKGKVPLQEIDRAVLNQKDYLQRHERVLPPKVERKPSVSRVQARRKRR